MLRTVKKIMALAGKNKTSIKVSIFTALIYSIFISFPYMAIYLFFRDFVNEHLTEKTIGVCSGIFVIGILGGIITKTITMRLQQCTGNDVAAKKRIELGDHLRSVPMGFFQEKNLGEVTTVLTNDISSYEHIANVFLEWVINGVVSAVVSGIILSIFDWHIGIVFLVTTVVALVIMNIIQNEGMRIITLHKKAQTAAISATLEFIRGITVFKLFSMGGENVFRTKEAYRDYQDAAYRLEMEVFPWNILLNITLRIGMAMVILLAPILTIRRIIPMETGVLMILAGFQIFKPIEELAGASNTIRVLENTINRMEEISEFPTIDEKSKNVKLKYHDITFDKVSFSYEKNKRILEDVSFQIPDCTMTAIVGSSGSGKSTVARLIARFWDIQSGSIKIGGVDVKDITCEALLNNIAIVFQNVYLFNDTIEANIRYGKPDATQSEIEEAAKKARCHEFIVALAEGYETLVGESGSHLSGGEKQRISIARAILKNAPIVLLDEATSSIDPDNEVAIQQAISELVKDKTLIVIAHRLKTIQGADQILVIEAGKLVEAGTHEQLLKKEGVYEKFWNISMQ
ncbi:MAG: ABC transporter ATP-binding protein [Velocimicrobium sp.]